MPETLTLRPGELSLLEFRRFARGDLHIALDRAAAGRIDAGAGAVRAMLASGEAIYGVNTGFGALARTRIPDDKLRLLQQRLVISHAAGSGPLLPDAVVRLALFLKIASLAHGRSGVRREVIDLLISLVNAGAYPAVPAKGSVGASGDLAPLAHLAQVLIGAGEVRIDGVALPGAEGLRRRAPNPRRPRSRIHRRVSSVRPTRTASAAAFRPRWLPVDASRLSPLAAAPRVTVGCKGCRRGSRASPATRD
jgi:histidine ammonia-lyase